MGTFRCLVAIVAVVIFLVRSGAYAATFITDSDLSAATPNVAQVNAVVKKNPTCVRILCLLRQVPLLARAP